LANIINPSIKPTNPKRYGGEHAAPELQAEAVYGLTELHRDEVRGARLVANPGC
jgi:N-acetyl-gamma-glutamylphosphate reductase